MKPPTGEAVDVWEDSFKERGLKREARTPHLSPLPALQFTIWEKLTLRLKRVLAPLDRRPTPVGTMLQVQLIAGKSNRVWLDGRLLNVKCGFNMEAGVKQILPEEQ